MVMQFGQFLDHDITLTPESEAHGCCTDDAITGVFAAECFPINFPCNDPTFSNLGCITYKAYKLYLFCMCILVFIYHLLSSL